MRVLVLSHKDFDACMAVNGITPENVAQSNIILISINNTGEHNRLPYFPKSSENVCVLHFDDVDTDPKDGSLAMTDEQGRELIIFLLSQPKDRVSCIVHCAAGISRSWAVGAFINDFYGLNYDAFKRDNPKIQPNAHISAVLNKLFREEF